MKKLTKPQFPKHLEADLFTQLRREVNATVKILEPLRRTSIVIKALLFPALYFLSYAAALVWGHSTRLLYTFYSMMGVSLVLNFLNLIHEAVHGTLFRAKWLNNIYVHLFDLMGANSYIWKIRHLRLHHNYPNVMGWDSDFEHTPLARFFPHGSFSKVHKYQHIYMPLIYPLFVFNWLLVRDFKDFFDNKRLVRKMVNTIPKTEYFKFFVFKILFLFYIVVIPALFFDIPFVHVIIAFAILMFTASIVSLLVLLSPHGNIENAFPLPDANGKMPTSWFRHQMICANDIKADNWFVRFFMGCFNYHVAHHLFPSINHVYYPEVTKIIQRFAAEHQLPYRQFSMFTSLRNHYSLLRNNALGENIFEETM